MPDSLATVLSAEVGFDICNGLYNLLIAHHGEGYDPATIPPEHRTVLLIWHTQRVIGNNGFNGFFAADIPGDPDYRHMRAAYETVGCEPAALAIRNVFAGFPEGTVPADPRARVQAFGKANHAVHGALNRDFTKVQGALTSALAQYIRNHADAFVGVDKPGVGRPAASPARSTSKPDPAEVGAPDLPHWAKVAFYARCARQVFPLWEEAWPDAPGDYHNAVEQVIVLAEMSAAEARPAGDLRAAGASARRVAEAAVAAQSGSKDPPPVHATRAALIAATAGSVADLISGDDETSSYILAKGVIADADHDDLLEDIQEDFQRIRQHARDCDWTDKTPVPPDAFSPTYKPKKTWWKRW